MITENLSTLKIHKLTQEQYDRELAAGRLDENAIYLTPDEEVDLSSYVTFEQLSGKADAEHIHEDINTAISNLNTIVGDAAVSTQIENALKNYLLLTGGTISGPLNLNGNIILSSASYGTTLPDAGTAGRIFFKRA